MKTKKEIAELAQEEDYAFLYGAGIMYANDDEIGRAHV